MTVIAHPRLPDTATVSLDADEPGRIRIHDLSVVDAVLADLLASHDELEWESLVGRTLSVGARGLVTMGLGVNLDDVQRQVRQTLDGVAERARELSEHAVDSGKRALAEQFDPDLRSSLIARAIADFATMRDQMLDRLNPQLADSDAALFISSLQDLLGPQGQLEQRLTEALDPDADGSALRRLADSVDAQFTELRDLVAREQGRTDEAEKGTAKGLAFEDLVEERLRELAAHLGGCVVERTSRTPGEAGADAVVGDMVVTLPTGARVVVEAKNVSRLGLGGKSGILVELDRAMANRKADYAICISGQDAFPLEVGGFGVYGNRVLVVDPGDGVMAGVALRWAAGALESSGSGSSEVDTAALGDKLERIKSLVQRFSGAKKSLTDVQRSVEVIRESLDGMRVDLLDAVDEARRELGVRAPGSAGAGSEGGRPVADQM